MYGEDCFGYAIVFCFHKCELWSFYIIVREADLHPYGGQGVLHLQGHAAYIDWDNGTRSWLTPEEVARWEVWLEKYEEIK